MYVNESCDCHWFPQRYKKRWLLTSFYGSDVVEDETTGVDPESWGTPGYRAPESLHGGRDFSRKSDVWAIGCLLYELAATGKKKAFSNDRETLAFIEGRVHLPQVDAEVNSSLDRETYCPKERRKRTFVAQVNSIIGSCLVLQPSDRATVMQLKVRFEELKAYLITDTSDEEMKRYEL